MLPAIVTPRKVFSATLVEMPSKLASPINTRAAGTAEAARNTEAIMTRARFIKRNAEPDELAGSGVLGLATTRPCLHTKEDRLGKKQWPQGFRNHLTVLSFLLMFSTRAATNGFPCLRSVGRGLAPKMPCPLFRNCVTWQGHRNTKKIFTGRRRYWASREPTEDSVSG